MNCVFCELEPGRIVRQNDLALAIGDKFPIVPGHTLIIPKRHCVSYFELSAEEAAACHALMTEVREQLMAEDSQVRDFNIGINDGPAAGQTVAHCHIHLVPRRSGDVRDPRGGVRHVIPGKGNYEK